MALKAVVDTLEGIEEHFHSLYSKKGEKFEFTGVEGLKTSADIDRLQTALNAERKLKKELEAYKESWGDLDPVAARSVLDKVPALEALVEAGKNKLDDKQTQAIVNAQVVPVQRQLDKALADLKERDSKIEEYGAKETRRTIFDAVRKYATENKANPEAYGSDMGGLMLLSKEIFTLDAAGQVVIKEGATDIVPHGTHIKDAFPEIQKSFSYFWPPSQGGGATGGGNPSSVSGNPFKTNDMTARSKFAKEHPEKVPAALAAAGLQTVAQLHKDQKSK